MAKPVVDRLAAEMDEQVTLTEINLLSDIGRQAATELGLRMVPATLLFDGHGRVLYRHTGIPNAEEIRSHLGELGVRSRSKALPLI